MIMTLNHPWQCYGKPEEMSYQMLSTPKMEKVMPATSLIHLAAVCPPAYSKYCLRDWLVCCKIDKTQVAQGIS